MMCDILATQLPNIRLEGASTGDGAAKQLTSGNSRRWGSPGVREPTSQAWNSLDMD